MAPAFGAEDFVKAWALAQPRVAAYLAAVLPGPQADDVLQNVAVALLRKLPEYDPARPFLPWAVGVARFEALAHRRDAARAPLLEDPRILEQLEAAAADEPADPAVRGALRACLEQVTGRARELLRLRYEEELSPLAIAERLGTSSGSVRVTLTRVRSSLLACIERRLAARPAEGS